MYVKVFNVIIDICKHCKWLPQSKLINISFNAELTFVWEMGTGSKNIKSPLNTGYNTTELNFWWQKKNRTWQFSFRSNNWQNPRLMRKTQSNIHERTGVLTSKFVIMEENINPVLRNSHYHFSWNNKMSHGCNSKWQLCCSYLPAFFTFFDLK